VGVARVLASKDVVDRLSDDRGRRVVFVSHCLLNQNVRFLGGATRSGAVDAAVEPYLRDGVGIVQLPCPEQRAWGGVQKRWMLACYGRRLLRWRPARGVFVAAVRGVTAFEYGRLARRTAIEIADYVASGFEVVEVVGVGASPSCGVATTVDVDAAIAAMARCDRGALTPAMVRQVVVASSVVDGTGRFVASLRRQLARRGVSVPFREHDLLAELRTTRP
jgi:predicted secreted protein